MRIAHDARIGIICRGGPVNGPYAAGALKSLKEGLAQRGLMIANLYGNSASVPDAVLSAIHLDDLACDTWANLRPQDLITEHRDWAGQVRTVWRLLRSESIFDDAPMEQLLKRIVPRCALFADAALPVKIMTVDYLTGQSITFSNKDPRHYGNWYAGMLGSMALVPFLKPQIAYEVVESGLLAEPYIRSGPFADIAVLIDGGYADNLMFDAACSDGNDVVFVVDINGLALGPLETYRWNHWSLTLQRAFHVLVTTNDGRRFSGVQRTNEVIAIARELTAINAMPGVPAEAKRRIVDILHRMDQGVLGLADKREVSAIHVGDLANSRPFDFASFTPTETMHLLHCGQNAATRALEHVEVV